MRNFEKKRSFTVQKRLVGFINFTIYIGIQCNKINFNECAGQKNQKRIFKRMPVKTKCHPNLFIKDILPTYDIL